MLSDCLQCQLYLYLSNCSYSYACAHILTISILIFIFFLCMYIYYSVFSFIFTYFIYHFCNDLGRRLRGLVPEHLINNTFSLSLSLSLSQLSVYFSSHPIAASGPAPQQLNLLNATILRFSVSWNGTFIKVLLVASEREFASCNTVLSSMIFI